MGAKEVGVVTFIGQPAGDAVHFAQQLRTNLDVRPGQRQHGQVHGPHQLENRLALFRLQQFEGSIQVRVGEAPRQRADDDQPLENKALRIGKGAAIQTAFDRCIECFAPE